MRITPLLLSWFLPLLAVCPQTHATPDVLLGGQLGDTAGHASQGLQKPPFDSLPWLMTDLTGKKVNEFTGKWGHVMQRLLMFHPSFFTHPAEKPPSILPTTISNLRNPILPGLGVCDPHIHIFNERAYLYASHDFSPDNQDWIMHDWQIWSSANLVDWTLERTVRPEETYVGPWTKCWATDAAERNGRFYFYFSKANLETGVLVGENPGGPFVDVLRGPLLPEKLTPTRSYDPTPFVDDDGTPYIIFGNHKGKGYFISRLNEDMVSLAEAPVNIRIDDGYARTDKSFLHKHNGLYYLSWDSNYAVSKNIYGPYRYVGNIGASHDHGSFFEWKGQCFNAFTIFDPTYYFRATGICYIHYRDNGEMVADQIIVYNGVGQYDADWIRIEAEWFMATEGTQKRENESHGFDVVPMSDGSHLCYPKVRNLRGKTGICFYASNLNPRGGIIEVREGTPEGRLMATCEIPCTFSHDVCAYRTFTCRLDNSADRADLCLVFKGCGEGMLRLDWWKLYK